MSSKLQLEKDIVELTLENAANIYTKSKATTNAGRILRIIVSLIPTGLIIKMFAQKLSK